MKDNNKRILVLATTFPRNDERSTHPVYDLSQELKNNIDVDITVLAPHHPGSERRERMSNIDVRRFPYFLPKQFQKLCYEGGIFDTIQRNPFLIVQLPLLFTSMLFHAAKITATEDIDLVHSHWLVPCGAVGAIISRVFRVPHVLTLHAGGVLGMQKIPFNSYICSFIYQNSTKISPVSSYIRDKYIEMLPESGEGISDEFIIQPMAADPSHYDLYDRTEIRERYGYDDQTIGLFVGNFVRNKGIEYLIESIERLDYEGGQFKMVIVGKGPLEEEIHQRVSNSDSQDHIELTGFVSKEKLNQLYVSADFVVVPSIVDSAGNTEGMPTVISEAFVSGTPVIASDVGGISDVVQNGQNGFLVQQKRPNKLSYKIDSLLTDDDLLCELSSRATETGDRLTWKYCALTYVDIYQLVW